MNARFCLTIVWAAIGIALAFEPAFAQRGDRERRRFDPAELLQRMDANKNGQIEPNEVSGRAGRFIEQAATRAGLDPKQSLPIDKLSAAMQGESSDRDRDSDDRDRDEDDDDKDQDKDDKQEDRSASSGSSSSPMPSAPALVPGFGVAAELTAPRGFDAPVEKTNRYARPLEERFEQKVLDRVAEMLRDHDKNKNGLLEYKTEENEGVRWSFPPEQSDKNADGKLDREELCYRIAKVLGSRERESNDRDRNRERGGDKSSEAGDSGKVRRYAEGLLKQYDENKNGVLEKDEWSKMRGDPEKADTNGDKIVTIDELAARLGSYGREESSDKGSSSSAKSESSGESRRGNRARGERREGSDDEKKSYRFLTPLERLPKGLPTWFTRNDADGDGQVTMAEYSTSYNDTTVAEFAKFDLDGDGFITPAECLRAESSKTAKK